MNQTRLDVQFVLQDETLARRSTLIQQSAGVTRLFLEQMVAGWIFEAGLRGPASLGKGSTCSSNHWGFGGKTSGTRLADK